MTTVRDRLARPELEPLCDELVRRYEASDRLVATITLRELDEATRRAIADLLGSDRLPPATCRVVVRHVAAALGTDAAGLRSALCDLRGPFIDRAADRLARSRQREELWGWLQGQAHSLGIPIWAETLRIKGVPRGDVGAHHERLRMATDVLRRLPADDIPLAGLACDLFGDPHSLDHGTWLSSAVLDGVAELAQDECPSSAEDGRRLWASVGVVADGLSSSVLCLGIRPPGRDPLVRFLKDCSDASEPVAITVAQMQRWPIVVNERIVYAFENPSILVQAARGGWTGPPLLCASGWPNVAAITLTRQVKEGGATVRYHGDFDPNGIAIAEMLVQRVGVDPWRMSTDDYVARVGDARVRIDGGVPEASWDPNLASAMRENGVAVFEENMRDELLNACQY